MKASKKYLSMEIQFCDYADLRKAFSKAMDSIKGGKEWNRFNVGSLSIQYNMERDWDDEDEKANGMDYREEIIDGQLCMIIQSKMNKPKPIKAKLK